MPSSTHALRAAVFILFVFASILFAGPTAQPVEPTTNPAINPGRAGATTRPLVAIEDFDKAVECILVHSSAKKVEPFRREILEHIYNTVGLRLPEGAKITVAFGNTNLTAAALTYDRPGGAHILIGVDTMERYKRDYKEVFQHEMLHAMQNCWWTQKQVATVPSWLKEGLATYVGGNGPSRVNRFAGRPGVLDGLGSHGYGRSSDYMEDYLAISFIEKTWGEVGLKKFVRDLTVDCMPWEMALRNATGLEFKEFAGRARGFAVEQINAAGATTRATTQAVGR